MKSLIKKSGTQATLLPSMKTKGSYWVLMFEKTHESVRVSSDQIVTSIIIYAALDLTKEHFDWTEKQLSELAIKESRKRNLKVMAIKVPECIYTEFMEVIDRKKMKSDKGSFDFKWSQPLWVYPDTYMTDYFKIIKLNRSIFKLIKLPLYT